MIKDGLARVPLENGRYSCGDGGGGSLSSSTHESDPGTGVTRSSSVDFSARSPPPFCHLVEPAGLQSASATTSHTSLETPAIMPSTATTSTKTTTFFYTCFGRGLQDKFETAKTGTVAVNYLLPS